MFETKVIYILTPPLTSTTKCNNVCMLMGDLGGGQSGMRPEKRVKGGVFFKTTCDVRDAFRGAKTPFFRKRGVSNFSGDAIRVMFSVL